VYVAAYKTAYMKIISLIVYLLISTIYVNAQTNEQVEEYLNTKMVDKKIPGLQLVVIKENEIVYATEMGNANVSFSVPVDENTVFSINSIGKIFTATAIMQLVEPAVPDLQSGTGILGFVIRQRHPE